MTKVSADASANRTGVTLATISTTAQTVIADSPGVFVMRTIASPFGHNAPKEPIYSNGVLTGFDEWLLEGESDTQITLSSRQDKILASSWGVVERENNFEPHERLWTFAKVNTVTHLSVARYGIAGSATQLSFDKSVWVTEQADLSALRKVTITAQNEELTVAELPLTYPVYGSTLVLHTRVEGLVPGRPVAISGKRQRLRIRHQPVTFSRTEKPGPAPRLLIEISLISLISLICHRC